MPSGTLFRKVSKSYAMGGDLAIKVCDPSDGWSNDFIEVDLGVDFKESSGSSDDFEIWDDMFDNGLEPRQEWNVSRRDGLFESEQMFLVYDKDEVREFIATLQGFLL